MGGNANQNYTLGSAVPSEFRCPVTLEVMEYPYSTSEGYTYEYGALVEWFKNNKTDPISNVPVRSKNIYPNYNLRSQIQQWFENNPEKTNLRNKNAVEPLQNLLNEETPLDKIMLYRGLRDESKCYVPQTICLFEHNYKFSLLKNKASDKLQLSVQCDSQKNSLEFPHGTSAMHVTKDGIVFYDPKLILETRVIPGKDGLPVCSFGQKCDRKCDFTHPFVCPVGVNCEQKQNCKFSFHPEKKSVNLEGFPCKWATACTNKTCKFGHPNGRLAIKRQPAKIYVTHSLTVKELSVPIPLPLEIPVEATYFQFQGEFVFFFIPYPNTWAEKHFKTVIFYRFNNKSMMYKKVGEYSLDKHYCNCVVGNGRFLVFSFWPYEEEAVRSIWENVKEIREFEKKDRKQKKHIKALQQENEELSKFLLEKDNIISSLKKEIQSQRQEIFRRAKRAREEHKMRQENIRKEIEKKKNLAKKNAERKARLEEEKLRRMQRKREWERNERLRYRDPIHIYALHENASGDKKEDWELLVDYHKGAHDISLLPASQDGSQTLEITENSSVYQFDIIAPSNLNSLGLLPVVPSKLCEDF